MYHSINYDSLSINKHYYGAAHATVLPGLHAGHPLLERPRPATEPSPRTTFALACEPTKSVCDECCSTRRAASTALATPRRLPTAPIDIVSASVTMASKVVSPTSSKQQ